MNDDAKCPKCFFAREPGAVECPACGIVYARYRGAPPPPLPGGSAAPGLPLAPPQAPDLNPYAPPASDLLPEGMAAPPTPSHPDVGVWRFLNLLVMDKRASLPRYCLRCGRPASTTLKRNLSWHHPLIYLTLLANLLVYLVVALLVRKQARVELPLCDDHVQQRRVWLTLGSIAFLLGVGLTIWTFSADDLSGAGCWLSVTLVVLGFATVALVATPVSPRKIDDRFVWLKKVSPEYLERLPEAPIWLPPL
ncbi:MAG TPA: hypothetical protein VKU40_15455 [Thermoanaerobaculia bacterium]|nr:hypothetical protein [Thermoanaerobaculia bacterium]